MKQFIGKFILFIFGWKTVYKPEFQSKKCVMVAAPHTSNWDLFFSIAFYWKENIEAKFFIKDDWTKGIHGYFIKKLGGIGVTRGKKNNLVDLSIKTFNENENFILLVPAEATRKRVKKWKRGFYVIAQGAKVPIALGYLDYKEKIASVGALINLTNDFERDMMKIEEFYKNITAKHPENYNPKIF